MEMSKKMKNLFATLAATTLIGIAPYALAASSTDLTVTGIITPSACTPTLSNGGLVEYDKISVKDLKPTTVTQLSPHAMQLTVSCEAPAEFALKAIDNRPGTTSNRDWFGIGRTDAGEPLGFIVTTMRNPLADAQPARTIVSFNNGDTWYAHHHYRPNWLMSVASTTDLTTPIAVKDFAVELLITAHIAPANDLTLTEETPFEGSVTYELNYL